MDSKAFSIVAIVVALVAAAFAFFAFMEAQEANQKADNLMETLEDEQVAGIPLTDDGALDEEAWQQRLQQQQPTPEELEELEEEFGEDPNQ